MKRTHVETLLVRRFATVKTIMDASVIVGQLGDVRISEGDQFLLYMRNLPNKVQEFLQLHQNATTVNQIKVGVQDHYVPRHS